MIDSHCHLADTAFSEDLDSVIARARAAGVTEALCILSAIDEEESARAREVLRLWPTVVFAVGVHPHTAGKLTEKSKNVEAFVRRAISETEISLHSVSSGKTSRVRAIGEIGLDYHYEYSEREVQREVFRQQLRLSREIGLPVVIHTRDADADTLKIIEEEGQGRIRGVFHCFTGDGIMARRVVDLGFHVSFSGIVTFTNAAKVREAAELVPSDRLLVETDSPYLAPVPHRGGRNEPALVKHVLSTIAETRGEAVEQLQEQTSIAFRNLIFGEDK